MEGGLTIEHARPSTVEVLQHSMAHAPETTNVAGQWRPEHVAAAAATPFPHGPLITAATAEPLLPGYDLWDMWPLLLPDGCTASVCGGTLWFILGAPIVGGPNERHFSARIHLLFERDGRMTHLGPALPDHFGPGNREWSGSAVLFADDQVRLFYTAAGTAGEERGYRQRLMQTSATLDCSGLSPRLGSWSAAAEIVVADGSTYRIVDQREGEIGAIKAFRDPAYFRDPADGTAYIVFTASLARSVHSHDGCIGIARACQAALDRWELLPPLVTADALNNELERPHIVCRDGHYYLFWSTQSSVFAPGGPIGPTGLYGMVARHICGPYTPVNGTGLVLGNPPAAPYQAFSWHVERDGRVASFVDSWGRAGEAIVDEAAARTHFGGTPAPFLQLMFDGEQVTMAD
jgi:levansucrase